MRKNYLFLFLLLLFSTGVFAQTRVITGAVIDSASKETLPGVTITIKGSAAAASSDKDGNYIIKTSNNENVTIGARFIGYKYAEITLKAGQNKANFVLVSSNKDLADVVVTGYGTTLKSKLLGAVSEIKAQDVQDISVANFGQALQDRVAGVGISVASGKPGATSTLSIRSPTVFGSGLGITSDPLYVIDGIIAQKSDFDNLDASLIESVSFLKDSQAAIYGAAGDKGVVLVTTKRGKTGKTEISYTGYFGTTTDTEEPKMMTGLQLAQYLNDDYALNNSPATSRFSAADLSYIATHQQKSIFDQLWHSADMERHTLSLTGGSDKLTFFAGGSYFNQGGNFGDISVTKWNIHTSLTAHITNDITAFVSVNGGYSTSSDNGAKSESSDTENYMVASFVTTPGWIPLYINGIPNGFTTSGPGFWNPVSYLNSGSYSKPADQTINLNSSIEWRAHFIRGLTAKVQYGKTNYSNNSKNYYPSYTVAQFTASGQNGLLYGTTYKNKSISNSDQILESYGYNNTYELIGSLDYARSIGKNNFDVLYVTEQTEANADQIQFYRTGQQIPGVDQFFAYNSGTSTLQTTAPSETGKRSYLVRANYDYESKYLMEFIAREDGSSNFPPDKRWGLFPSLAVGWRISEEDFFKNSFLSKYVNSLKLRFNEGLVGDDRVTPYQYASHFTPYSGTMLFGSSVVNGLTNGILPNTDITWEHSRTQNLGLDATFLNNRLTVTVDRYSKHVYDGFVDISTLGYPATLGISSGIINYASANSWGEDFSVSWNDNIKTNWHYGASLVFGWGNGENIQQYYNPLNLGEYTQSQLITIGEKSPNNGPYGLIATGIIRTQAQLDAILKANPNYTIEGKVPQLGFMNFKDINHDGKINADDITQMFKDTRPWLSTGFTFNVAYKELALSVNGHLTLGGKVFISGQDVKAPTTTVNGPEFWADHWTPSNPNAKYPRADAPDAGSESTFWARNGTTGYINNASLSYKMPKSISDKLGIPSLRVVVTAINPWEFIDPYDYKDSRTGNISYYPTLRTISVGLNATL